jgi:Transglutaminase-like superfamily
LTVLTPATATLQDAQGPLPIRWKASLTAEILVTYGRVRWLMARNELPATLEALREPNGAPAPDPGDAELTWQVGERLGFVAARTLDPFPGDSRCLMRSLVLTAMMARRGIQTTLVIGAKTDEGFEAHAWVEREGIPILSQGSGYGRLAEL